MQANTGSTAVNTVRNSFTGGMKTFFRRRINHNLRAKKTAGAIPSRRHHAVFVFNGEGEAGLGRGLGRCVVHQSFLPKQLSSSSRIEPSGKISTGKM
jgi:hypothetical protein